MGHLRVKRPKGCHVMNFNLLKKDDGLRRNFSITLNLNPNPTFHIKLSGLRLFLQVIEKLNEQNPQNLIESNSLYLPITAEKCRNMSPVKTEMHRGGYHEEI